MPIPRRSVPRPARCNSNRWLGALLVAAAVLLARPSAASAQSTSCPPGNLLSRARLWQWLDVGPNRGLVTDGAVGPEGAMWNSTPALILNTAASSLTYDLGAVYSIEALFVQADANDVYHFWGSVDGRTFQTIGRIDVVEGVHGLRSRKLVIGGTPLRYLRFGEGVGDNYFSVSEIQAFCQLPDPFPPKLRIVDAPVAQVQKNIYTYWNNDVSSRWELILALLGLSLLLVDWRLRRTGREQWYRRLRDRLLMALGGIALLTYFNFGFLHFGNQIHDWEWTHYYVGAKYFRELSYDRLYECIAVADTEEPLLRRRVELRKLTNLRTNALETTADILAHPDRCTSHFSAQRWQDFKHDVKFFRDRQSSRRWDDLQTDHGYNGTPVWNIAGSLLANLAPASVGWLYGLATLDPLYLLGMVAVIWWAFGWRVTCVGLLVFATNFPSRFYWTGGSFLRWDWLFYTVAAVCCFKKDRPLLAGMALSYAALLRVFPGFIFLGPLLAAGYHLVRTRKLDPAYTRFFAGAALAAALLIPVSLQVGSGAESYRRFVQNTQKHKETPLTNYMGLRTVLAYRPSETGAMLRNDRYTDPWIKWKEARLRDWHQALPVYAVLVVGFLVMLGFAVRERPSWQTAALGVTFIPFGVELTCYYYAFVIAVALLHAEDERVGSLLLALTAFTGFIDWRPIPGMATWLDEQYTAMSAGTLIAFLLIVWEMGLGKYLRARAAARLPAAADLAVVGATGAVPPAGGGGAVSGAVARSVPAASAASAPAAARWASRTPGRKKKKRRV
jgi:hypothetical protein